MGGFFATMATMDLDATPKEGVPQMGTPKKEETKEADKVAKPKGGKVKGEVRLKKYQETQLAQELGFDVPQAHFDHESGNLLKQFIVDSTPFRVAVDEIMDEHDLDGDGMMSKDEWIASGGDPADFDELDDDGCGQVDKHELAAFNKKRVEAAKEAAAEAAKDGGKAVVAITVATAKPAQIKHRNNVAAARFKRIESVDKAAKNLQPIGRVQAAHWIEKVLLEGEVELMQLPTIGFFGMPGAPSKLTKGYGMLLLTKLDGMHRLHYLSQSEHSKVSSNEKWNYDSETTFAGDEVTDSDVTIMIDTETTALRHNLVMTANLKIEHRSWSNSRVATSIQLLQGAAIAAAAIAAAAAPAALAVNRAQHRAVSVWPSVSRASVLAFASAASQNTRTLQTNTETGLPVVTTE